MTKDKDISRNVSHSEDSLKIIKFWSDRCKELEKVVDTLKQELLKYRGY